MPDAAWPPRQPYGARSRPGEYAQSDFTSMNDLKDGRRAFNERYLGAMAHYGVEADWNTPGRAHENGSVEQAHYRETLLADNHGCLVPQKDREVVTNGWPLTARPVPCGHPPGWP